MSVKNTESKPVWMKLAEAFSAYIKPTFRYIRVYEGEVPGFGLAAIIRVWENEGAEASDDEEESPNVHVKVTISITANIVWCTDRERGIREMDLEDPQCFEKLLNWMKLVEITDPDVQLSGILI